MIEVLRRPVESALNSAIGMVHEIPRSRLAIGDDHLEGLNGKACSEMRIQTPPDHPAAKGVKHSGKESKLLSQMVISATRHCCQPAAGLSAIIPGFSIPTSTPSCHSRPREFCCWEKCGRTPYDHLVARDHGELLMPGHKAFITHHQSARPGQTPDASSRRSVLCELISARYERRSILPIANQPFGEWKKVFPIPLCAHCRCSTLSIEASGLIADASARCQSGRYFSDQLVPATPSAIMASISPLE